MPTRTFGTLIDEARALLQDKIATDGAFRYSDAEMFECINGFLHEIRAKRADLFLPMGLRNTLPVYDPAIDMATAFPLDQSVYSAVLYYTVGRSELREDTFSNDGRATVLMNKGLSQLLGVAS